MTFSSVDIIHGWNVWMKTMDDRHGHSLHFVLENEFISLPSPFSLRCHEWYIKIKTNTGIALACSQKIFNFCSQSVAIFSEGKKNFIYNEESTTSMLIGKSYKTLVVRHPFERILSTYLYFFHKVLGKYKHWHQRICWIL